jgi:hypothetical protein
MDNIRMFCGLEYPFLVMFLLTCFACAPTLMLNTSCCLRTTAFITFVSPLIRKRDWGCYLDWNSIHHPRSIEARQSVHGFPILECLSLLVHPWNAFFSHLACCLAFRKWNVFCVPVWVLSQRAVFFLYCLLIVGWKIRLNHRNAKYHA